jgi:poly-gamma-glutamate synthesis protein (capsule biosynthesis protein)
MPTQPPLVTPANGGPVDFSLGWRFGSYGHLVDAALIYQDRLPVLVVASLDRNAYALDDRGEMLWKAGTAGPVHAIGALDGSHIVIGDDAGAVTLLDEQGNHLWQHGLGSRVTALDTEGQDMVLAGGWQGGPPHGGVLALLRGEEESELEQWQVDLGAPVSGVSLLSVAPHPSLPEGILAVGATLNGEVRALDASGVERWRFDAGAPVTGVGPLETEVPHLLVGTQDGRLLALDTAMGRGGQLEDGGRLRWQQAIGEGGPVWHVGDLDDDPDLEIVAGTGGQSPALVLLSNQGETQWRLALGAAVNAVSFADIDSDGSPEILAGLASGEIHAYDTLGQFRGSLHAGLPVWDLVTGTGGETFALADVVAWQILEQPGPDGSPWLPAPALIVSSEDSFYPASECHASGDKDAHTATIIFLGDVAPGRSMEAQLLRYGPRTPWEGISPLLEAADLAVANLESVLSTRGHPRDKTYLIRAHPSWGQALIAGGFGLVSLSNNHALDYEQVGLDETLATLEHLGILAVGAGRSSDSKQAHRPALFDLNGVRVAVLGYAAARWNGSKDVPATDSVAWAEPEAIQADVDAVRDLSDFVVVLLHAGKEYATEPSPDQVAAARAAIDAGADLVVGHHPHVTQTVERYEQGLIVYSLGDAVFDIPRQEALYGQLLCVQITEGGLAKAELWPFWIEDALRPRLLDNGEGRPVIETIYP